MGTVDQGDGFVGFAVVGYHGFGSHDAPAASVSSPARDGKWDGELDISSLIDDTGVQFFYPFTTTLIELTLNREPLPLDGVNQVCWF